MVQCSLRTADPALAHYLVTVIDREIMKPEHEKETIINRIKAKVNNADVSPYPGVYIKEAHRNGKSYPQSKIKIGDVEIDYDGDVEKEIAVARQLLGADVFVSKRDKAPVDRDGYTIPWAINDYIKHRKIYRNLKPKSANNISKRLQRYADYIGCELLADICRDKHRRYGQWLLQQISAATAVQEISTLNAFVKYLRNYDVFELPEVETIPSSVVESSSNKRVTFRPEHIADIANAIEYLTVQQRLIIALCFAVGARVGEIGQLLVADVKTEGDITYIDVINEDEDDEEFEEFKEKRKTVKNLNSKRLIPLPSALVGHVEALCNTAKRKGNKQLFYSVNDDVSGGRGGNASRTFLRRLRGAGYSPEYVTHSARYMFLNQ
jgi:integrase